LVIAGGGLDKHATNSFPSGRHSRIALLYGVIILWMWNKCIQNDSTIVEVQFLKLNYFMPGERNTKQIGIIPPAYIGMIVAAVVF
jgi:hypothetical protein